MGCGMFDDLIPRHVGVQSRTRQESGVRECKKRAEKMKNAKKEISVRWIASTYQRDIEPRDYQECSQVDEPRVRGMLIPRSCLPKSELLRDFQSDLITQLSSVLQSLKSSSRLLIRFSPSTVLSNIQFLFSPSGSGAPPTFSYTG
ncbi:hypothetical protein AVEN_109172-1 [Araneus ventricosus]|uniref:Uncharacterized protein n=1 Tax=Araneus ventricosus TaxID=182803 RepID=A0A4Y2JKE5_ARAVE|nr:hypothetical protein AVEN_109172-1 [Araneus ventricosus]